jgi:mono/diheme cytochrome c family protein
MRQLSDLPVWTKRSGPVFLLTAAWGLAAAVAGIADLPGNPTSREQVLRGRQLVIESNCGACHNRGRSGAAHNPDHPAWLSGLAPGGPHFPIGPFKTYARNLTPDIETGLGKVSERQIFNALRHGLKPGDGTDVVITSAVPGEGNFPASPKYLAPPMPWPSFRHMSDADLWAITAYLKHGIKAVSNKVPDNEGPPDFWVKEYAPGNYGPSPMPAFPMGNEEFKSDGSVTIEEVLHGRQLVLQDDCGSCHTRGNNAARHNPDHPAWLSGLAPGAAGFVEQGKFKISPRNLTPDNTTGLGRFSRRQLFNALRYGLRPGETPDLEITSTTPGEGNFPLDPKYLAPPMPWPSFRHMPDEELWAITAYLKHGIKPVSNKVPDSEGPPDFWASEYMLGNLLGPYPLSAFPMNNEELKP